METLEAPATAPESERSPLRVNQSLRRLPNATPVPDVETYERERELCLSLDARKKANFERYTASGRRAAKVDYLPIKLDIENVSRCNFRCTMCQVSEWTKGQRARDMTVDEFRRLVDEQYGLVEIKIQGMGEPTMARDALFDMIRHARAKHIWVRSVTNASLLHLRDNYRKIVDSGVNELQISIDGADKTTFEAIRRGSNFERVIANCKLVNGYCDARGVLRTKMWTVVQKANRHQLLDLVDLARELGFKTMVFSLNLTDWGQSEWRARNDAITVEEQFDLATATRLVERGRERGVKVAFWNVTSKYSTDSADRLCPWPFERAYIASDQRTVPCCMIANPDVFEIGGEGEGFTETWRGPAYEEFRQAHLDGRIPEVCRGCYERK